MRIAFLGSGTLACPLLRRIIDEGRDEIVGVVTQPDRKGGRGQRCLSCPLREVAQAYGLPLWAPERADEPSFLEDMKGLAPDVMIVASYGQFLKKALLDIPPHGTVNIHPSLLPEYRGASPIQWALANGDTETGVSVLYVTPRMDAGDILAQERADILPDDTFPLLEERLAIRGGELLVRVLREIEAGTMQPVPQDESRVTFARKLCKEDGMVDWTQPATVIRNRLRGFIPWPGSYTFQPSGDLLKLLDVRVEKHTAAAWPGTILDISGAGPLVAAGNGTALRLLKVQPAGKAAMSGCAYACGRHVQVGARLGKIE